jgi:hypothetical protein
MLVGFIVPSSSWTVSTALENFTVSDFHTIQVALNLEWLEAEYFLWASYGYGLDIVDPSLPSGGPEPIGVQKAKLDTFTTDIFVQLGLQEVGHLRLELFLTQEHILYLQLTISTSLSAYLFQKTKFGSLKFNFLEFQQLRNKYAKYTLYCVFVIVT